ncbi:hypothetical protein AMTR_s00107p00047780 [Amborella trichopoda]|uniref:Nuclear pore protein n=1 Tax=Amborella trichopoda TaxID=13333 RepID=W1NSZ7_AMBTC|nr:hypothetical protein AMTR_s00107p00047780 [Amborella trichopoda]
MATGEADVSSWTDLLHSSSKLLQQAAPSANFPPLQRNLDQLEALSKKLKEKTSRIEAPNQSIAAIRLLAREGINAEQLARDLKSFELKTTFEDIFPVEATSVEEYLQQVHEMAMVSAVQEAQKDNLRSFDDYMMQVLEDDWQKEKRDFLQSLSCLSTLPRTNSAVPSISTPQVGLISSAASSPQVSASSSGMQLAPLSNKPILEKKASAYAEVVRNLNVSRERGLPFNPAAAFRDAYQGLGLESSGMKSVSMQKIWHLLQTMIGEDSVNTRNVSRKMALVLGARHHLEWGHEKYILETIQSHPAQASLGGAVGNLQRIRAFLRIRLRDYGVLDFDAGDTRRHPPIDTTWQQVYFCLRTGYYDEARSIAQTSRVSHQFAPQLAEWILTGGMVSAETAAAASDECDKMLRMPDRSGRGGYDKKKLLLYAITSGSRRQIDRILRDHPSLFNTIEDFLWFKLSAVRDVEGRSSSAVHNEGVVPYNLDDLQGYLNKFEASYYTKNGKDPLVYPYVLLLSIQLLPAVQYLSKEPSNEGYSLDSVHIAIVLADQGILSESSGTRHKLGIMDAFAEATSIIRQFGSMYLRQDNLSLALEYYAQAAAAMGGGYLSWVGRSNIDQQRQRSLMLRQLLTELLLQDGGIALMLGPRGAGEEGELTRFMNDSRERQQFLLEAARQCQEIGLYDKSVDIHKRVGAFAMALETINKCLLEAICALSHGRSDGDSRTAGLIHAGNDILDTYKYSSETCIQERELILEQQTVLRQLEAILYVNKLARTGQHADALREITKLPFLPLDPRVPEITTDAFQTLSLYVQACVPDLLKVALTCLENMSDSDGILRAMRTKVFHWPASLK